jgi:hypothetical protein
MAISDDFGPIDDGTLVKWTPTLGSGYSITAEKCDTADSASSGYGCQLYTDETAGTSGNNWAKVTLTNLITDDYYGLALRGSGPASVNCYGVFVTPGVKTVQTVISTISGGSFQSDPFTDAVLEWSSGDTLGASIEGTDPNIVISIWQNPVGANPSVWGAADITHTIASGDRHDTGNYVGIIEWSAAGQVSIYDDFAGGSASGVLPELIVSTSGLFEPNLKLNQTLSADFISTNYSIFEPGVVNFGTLSVDFIASEESLFEPDVTQTEVGDSWFSGRWKSPTYRGQGTPWWGASDNAARPDTILTSALLYPPTLTAGEVTISVDFISTTQNIYEPTLSVADVVAAPFISSTETLYEPSVTAVLDQTLLVDHLNNPTALFVPALAKNTTIDGSDSLVISTNYQSKTLYSRPDGWFTID